SADSVDTINGKVDIWYDKSVNNILVTQSDINKQPVYSSINSQMNNQPSVFFDGVDDYIKGSFSSTLFNDSITLFFVQKIITSYNYSGSLVFVNNINSVDNNSPDNLIAFLDINGTMSAHRNNNSVLYQSNFITNPAIYQITTDGTTLKTYLNNVFADSISSAGAFAFDNAIVGSRWNTTSILPMNCDMFEIILYNRILSSTEQNQIIQYLYDKYTPPVYLGPDISANNFCDTTIHAGVRFTNYAWTKAGSNDTLSVDSTLAVSSSGNYSVTVTDIFGFTSTDSINVIFPNLSVIDSTICFGDTIKHVVIQSGISSFVWSNGDTGNVFQSTVGGQFTVQMTDNSGCTFNDTFYVYIDSLKLQLSLGNDTNLCYGNIISPVSGNNLINTSWWEPTNDTALFTTITDSGNYIIHSISYNGCTSSDTIFINMIGIAPIVGFITSNVCEKNITIFTDTSTTIVGDSLISWNWNIANSPALNDSVVSVTFDSAGTFPVLLTVLSSNGCSNTLQSQLVVNPLPVVNFSVGGNCLGENSCFTNLTTVTGSYTSLWSFGDDSVSSILNPTHVFQNLGFYNVKLISTSNISCTDSITKTIEIKPAPTANFDFSPACLGNSTYFFDLSEAIPIFSIQEWKWNFGSGDSSSFQNPNYVYNSIGQFNVKLYIWTSNGCADTITKIVTVSSPPMAGFIGDSACVGTPINFIDTSYILFGNINKWNWDFGNGLTSADSSSYTTYNSTGDYIVSLTVTSDVDCINSTSKIIPVYSNPTADFVSSVSIGPPPLEVNFTNNSLDAIYYYWNFGDSGQSQLYSPLHIFADTGNYTVWLKVRNSHGCVDSTNNEIKVVPEIYDLALLNLETTINNGYLSAIITIANQGTMPILNPQLVLNTNKNTPILEIYKGTILSEIKYYTFVSQIPINESNMPSYVCVKGSLSNGKTEIDNTNNEACKVLIQNQTLLSLFPNPTDNKLNINLNIKAAENSKLEIIDKTGRIVYSNNINMVVGFNHIEIDVSSYSKGKYTLRITNSDEEIKADFVKY
ncbi:MAG: hypothetical protein A2X08_04970, partial [Bacteroidetes bacterium GWA2_32_17]